MDHTHCKITCTTIGNEFVLGREAPMYHNDVYGNRVHDPPPMEKKLAMNMAQEVAETIPQRYGLKHWSNMCNSQA